MNARIGFVGLAAFGLVAAVGCSVKTKSTDTGAGGATSSSTQVSTGISSSTAVQATSTTSSTGGNTSTSSGSGDMWVAECNPVTNEGCTTGQACDASNEMKFVCFDPPNDAAVCTKCDNMNGPFCKGGYGCAAANGCAKYCCDDGDCGTGKCIKTGANGDANWPGVDVGVCLDDKGDSACNAPEMPPSGGKCVTPT